MMTLPHESEGAKGAAPAPPAPRPRWDRALKDRIRSEMTEMAGHFRGRLSAARSQAKEELGVVGERVRTIMTMSNDYVAALKDVLGDVTHGAAMEAVTEPHRRQAQAIERYLAAFEAQSAATDEQIRQALERCDDIRKARAGIGQVSQLSNILRLSAKVETVYLGQECREFESLADEMKQLNLDVIEVSQGVDELVIELRGLVYQLSVQGQRMRERTDAFASRFTEHLGRVKAETEHLRRAGLEASATGDQRAEQIKALAEDALAQLGFTGALDERLKALDDALGKVCDQATGAVGCMPIPRDVHIAPPTAAAITAEAAEGGVEEGELLLF